MKRRVSPGCAVRKQGRGQALPSSPGNVSTVRRRLSSTVSLTSGQGDECGACWEKFNASSHTPHALLCGHSLCCACVVGLPPAALEGVLHFPFLIHCPWCHWLAPRVHWGGELLYPCKNFSLLWLLDACHSPPSSGLTSPRDAERVPPAAKPPPRGACTPTPRERPWLGSDGHPAGAHSGEMHSAGADAGGMQACSRRDLPDEEARQNADREGGTRIGRRGGVVANALGSVRSFGGAYAALATRLAPVVWKLPHICALVFLLTCVLPLSIFVLGSYMLVSVVFVIPSSLVAIAALSFTNVLFRDIVR